MRITLFLFIVIAGASSAMAEPTPHDFRTSNSPLLEQARQKHLRYPHDRNQAEAEALFLEYIRTHPDDELVPRIYMELGYLFTSLVFDEDLERGAVRDREKAAHYFALAEHSYPEGKVGVLLLNAKTNTAALKPDPVQKFRGYVGLIQWIESMSRDQIRERLWQREGNPDPEGSIDGFARHLKQSSETATINMQHILQLVKDEDIRIALLSEAVERIPSSEIGQWAAERLEASGVRPPPQTMPATTQAATETAEAQQPPVPDPAAQQVSPETERDGSDSHVAYFIAGLVACLVLVGLVILARKTGKRQ